MLLRGLAIKNYRSLEDVELESVGQINVLIGRNNTGKSAVFGALQLLGQFLTEDTRDEEWERVLYRLDASRALEMQITFEPDFEQREQFLRLIGGSAHPPVTTRDTPLFRRVTYSFGSPAGNPQYLHLRETKILAVDSRWSTVQRMTGGESVTNPESLVTKLRNAGDHFPTLSADAERFDVNSAVRRDGSPLAGTYQVQSVPFQSSFVPDQGFALLRRYLVQFFQDAFFFTPHRRSEETQSVAETTKLSQDGSNLARVLHTLRNNHDREFENIERFVNRALPDSGLLRPQLSENSTRVTFRSPDEEFATRLHDMGGGVEQLLLAAVALETTGPESVLFLEEPEGHLHAGAQRYLMEEFRADGRQVFITTHSPTFVNLAWPKNLYRVSMNEDSTGIIRVRNQGQLGEVLEDVGARNSDVLLSDAVLFVEGPSDGKVLSTLASLLGSSLAERNIAVVPMGGSERIGQGARARSEVLEGISRNAPVPHMFIIDRDERSSNEVCKLHASIGEKLHVLQRRELENYLFDPYAIRQAILSKHQDHEAIVDCVEQTSNEQVEILVREAAEQLRGLVMLKRIRAEVAGLKGGLMTRDIGERLSSRADGPNLAEALREELRSRVEKHLVELELDAIVSEQKEALNSEWTGTEVHKNLAPGAEVLEAVFEHFGSSYDKSKDARRIAQYLREEDVPEELRSLIAKVAGLTSRN